MWVQRYFTIYGCFNKCPVHIKDWIVTGQILNIKIHTERDLTYNADVPDGSI